MSRNRRRRAGCLRPLLAIAAALVLVWFTAPYLLEAYARGFVVQDRIEPSDAVVALSGGNGERLHAAIQLYRERRARMLFIVGPDVPLLPVYTGGDSLTQGEAKRRIAIRRGVPADSVELALGPTSTLEEAATTLATCRARGWRSVIVVTSPFHTRRARATFRSVFKGSGVLVRVYHLPEGRSSDNPRRWWRRESDTMSILTETVKLGFYAWNHHVYPWG